MKKNKRLVPKRRFKEFVNTDGWEKREFRSTVTRLSTTSEKPELPRVEYEDIIAGQGELNKDIFEKEKNKIGIEFDEGDILFGKLRPYLKNWLLSKFKGIAVGDFWVLRTDCIDNKFIYYLIQTPVFQVVANQSIGTKMPRSDWSVVSETAFYIPNLIEEQVKIGAFFKNLDQLIILQQKKLNKIKALKSAYLSDLFPKEGEKYPKLRFDGFTEPWGKREFREVTNYVASSLSVGDAKNRGKFKLYDANGVIGYTNTNNQMKEYITIIKDGAGVGRVRLLPENSSFIGTMGAISSKEKNDIHFIYSILKKFNFSQYITGSTIPHIYYRDYGNAVNYYPRYQEQIKIGKFFEKIDNLIDANENKLEKLQNIKKAYLNELFL